MKSTKIFGFNHIYPKLVLYKDLIKVKCSPLPNSETKYVTPIEINLA
jgi:hypothetical protein